MTNGRTSIEEAQARDRPESGLDVAGNAGVVCLPCGPERSTCATGVVEELSDEARLGTATARHLRGPGRPRQHSLATRRSEGPRIRIPTSRPGGMRSQTADSITQTEEEV